MQNARVANLRPRDHDYFSSITEPKLLDELAVSIDFRALHVIEEPATLSNELEKPLAAVVILLVRTEMVGEVIDPFGQDRNLHPGGTGIGLVCPELLDGRSFVESHELQLVPTPFGGEDI
jgi:hypothetical protein